MVREDKGERSKLRREVGFFGVLGQSVAGVAPTTTPTINVALVFAVAGSGSWFAYLIATCGILLVALNLRHFARNFSGAGSLSDFAGHGLGPLAKLIAAWALLIAYVAVSAATLAGSAAYLSALFASAGLVAADPVLGRPRRLASRVDLRSSATFACRRSPCWRLNVSRSCWSCYSGWRSCIGKAWRSI